MALLELQNLTKSFGGLVAVNQLSLSVEKGEIVGLIGPNGAGKTTVFNTISGVLSPTNGKVFFNGQDITGLKPYSIVKKGLVRTFQVTAVFKDLTVLENIRLGCHLYADIGFFADVFNFPSKSRKEKELLEKAKELADFMGLGDKKTEIAKNLSHGHQRSLEMAIALAANPELLLLDEPVAGMSMEETTYVMEKIYNMQEKGITIFIVEHDMKLMMDICMRIYVLNFGKKLTEGTPDIICGNQEVITAYLGSGYSCNVRD